MIENIQNIFYLVILLVILILVIVLYVWIKYLSDKIKRQINESIKPDHIDLGLNADDLKKHAIEFWRLKCKLDKLGDKITEVDKQAINGSMDRLGRIFDSRNLRIHDMTGSKYNDGMNVEIIRAEKVEGKSEAKIIKTLER